MTQKADTSNTPKTKTRQDLTGKHFGKLTVLEYDSEKRKWKCQCECGTIAYKATGHLNSGAVSCGCSWRKPAVCEGERYGQLTVISPTEKRSARSVIWKCRCDCGNTVFVRAISLTSGHTTSCGCVKQKLDEEKDFRKILTYTDDTCIEFAKDISKIRANTSAETGVRGVVLKNGKYQAHIRFRKQWYYLGRYARLEDAVEIRKKAEARVEEYVEAYLSGNLTPTVNFDF